MIKSVPRSLVRVPGSGRDGGSAAPAISCDLGRVSSLAASISVNPFLPAIMTGTKLPAASPSNNSANNKLATSQVMIGMPDSPASPSSTRTVNSEAKVKASQETKRPRLCVQTTSTSANSHMEVPGKAPSNPPVVVSQRTQSCEGQKRPILTATRKLPSAKTTTPRTVPSPDYTSRTLEQLLEEQKNLREENRMLLQQLAHYTQLRQEKQRHLVGAAG